MNEEVKDLKVARSKLEYVRTVAAILNALASFSTLTIVILTLGRG